MKIRLAQVEDAEAMGEMLVTTWLVAHKGQMPSHLWERRQQEWTPDVSARGWRETLQEMAEEGDGRSCIYLATNTEDTIIGLSAAFAEADEPKANVVSLYVRQAYQGGGIGRLLLKNTFEYLRQANITTVHIGVLAANKPARQFYEKMGGTFIAERTFDEDGTPLPEVIYEWTMADKFPLLY